MHVDRPFRVRRRRSAVRVHNCRNGFVLTLCEGDDQPGREPLLLDGPSKRYMTLIILWEPPADYFIVR